MLLAIVRAIVLCFSLKPLIDALLIRRSRICSTDCSLGCGTSGADAPVRTVDAETRGVAVVLVVIVAVDYDYYY